jgi:hypothetical protein
MCRAERREQGTSLTPVLLSRPTEADWKCDNRVRVFAARSIGGKGACLYTSPALAYWPIPYSPSCIHCLGSSAGAFQGCDLGA